MVEDWLGVEVWPEGRRREKEMRREKERRESVKEDENGRRWPHSLGETWPPACPSSFFLPYR